MHISSSSDSFPKLRPIVSSIGAFNYNLTQFLCYLFSLLVSNDYSCKDIYFVFQINNANLSGKFLLSYNVTSRFTNILLHETIDLAINLISNHNPNLNITKNEIKKLFLFATSQTHFIFNCKFYKQIDGVAIGSPFDPLFFSYWQ